MRPTSKMPSDEEKPFLNYADACVEEHSTLSQQKQKHQHCLLTFSILANVISVLAFSILGLVILRSSNPSSIRSGAVDGITSKHELPDPYSPANAIIEHEYRSFVSNDTRFTGHPGPEWEQNMHKLMEGTLLRVSEEELKLFGTDSIPLKDGGYAAGLGIAHNLHCVKKIKKIIYRDHFYADLDYKGAEFLYIQSHADHCLDYLRQSVMCHLDYSMYTVYWGERQQDIPTHHAPGAQKCVNWEKLHRWMLERSASTDMLVRPRR